MISLTLSPFLSLSSISLAGLRNGRTGESIYLLYGLYVAITINPVNQRHTRFSPLQPTGLPCLQVASL
jgi:hypothetical protein